MRDNWSSRREGERARILCCFLEYIPSFTTGQTSLSFDPQKKNFGVHSVTPSAVLLLYKMKYNYCCCTKMIALVDQLELKKQNTTEFIKTYKNNSVDGWGHCNTSGAARHNDAGDGLSGGSRYQQPNIACQCKNLH